MFFLLLFRCSRSVLVTFIHFPDFITTSSLSGKLARNALDYGSRRPTQSAPRVIRTVVYILYRLDVQGAAKHLCVCMLAARLRNLPQCAVNLERLFLNSVRDMTGLALMAVCEHVTWGRRLRPTTDNFE